MEIGHRMSGSVHRTSVQVGRRMSRVVEGVRKSYIYPTNRKPSVEHPMIHSRISSDKSMLSEQLGAITDSPKARLLHELIHELKRIIDTDILPRWKKKTDIVERFLNGEPASSRTVKSALL